MSVNQQVKIRILLLWTILAAVAMCENVLYGEGFVPATPTYKRGNTTSLGDSAVGWKVYTATGADVTAYRTDPSHTAYDADSPDGDSYRIFMGSGTSDGLAMLSDAPPIHEKQRKGGLTISFSHRDTDGNGSSCYRVLLKVAGKWHASGEILTYHCPSIKTNWQESSIDVVSTSWIEFVDKLTEGFSVDIFAPGVPLPAGDIEQVGFLLVNADTGDNFRIDNVQIIGK